MYLNNIYQNYLAQNGGAKGLFKNGRMSARYYYDNYGEDDTIGDVCDYSEDQSGQNRCLKYNKFPKWVKITDKNRHDCIDECKYKHSGPTHVSSDSVLPPPAPTGVEGHLQEIFAGPNPNHFSSVPLKLQNNKKFAVRAMLRAGANIFNGIIKPNNPLLKNLDLYEAAIYGNMLLDSRVEIRRLGLVGAEKFENLHELIDVEDDIDNDDDIIGIENMKKYLMKNKKYFSKKQIKDFCNNKILNFFFSEYILDDFCDDDPPLPADKEEDDLADTIVLEMGTKFWKIENKYPNTIVTYGKIGTKGSTSIKKHSSKKNLTEFMNKMIQSKKDKGYKLSSDVEDDSEDSEDDVPVSKVDCKKFKKTVNPKCDSQSGCKWVPGKGKGCLPVVEDTDSSEDMEFKSFNYKDIDEDMKMKMRIDFNKCFNNFWDLSDIKTYVIMRKGDIVSFLQLYGNTIYNLCTPEKYRRQGYAKKLIDYVKSKYENNLNLYIDKLKNSHDKLLNYYKKMGFNEILSDINDKTKMAYNKCKKFKKTVNPKCDSQPGCKWVPGKGKGCLYKIDSVKNDDEDEDEEDPLHINVPDTDFDKIEVMKYKELRPREVSDNPSKLNKYVGWFMSEKIDGWQALWDGKGTLYTKSYKRKFAVPKEWLRLLPNIPLAGEIKIKGKAATNVASLQKSSPMWKDAEFFVFDLPGPNNRKLPFKTRVANIKKIVDKSCKSIPKCPLVSSEQTTIKNTKHLLEHYQKILKKNGEGLVITNPKSVYQTDGKRSSERVKLKGRNDSEGIVTGYKLGGKIGELKSLEIDFDGIIFNLGIGFNRNERENYKKIFPKGTVVKFSYRDLSSSEKPKEARFIEVREDL